MLAKYIMAEHVEEETAYLRGTRKQRERERRARIRIATSRSCPQWPKLPSTSPYLLKVSHFPIVPQAGIQAFNVWNFRGYFRLKLQHPP
jgi:hypothetical protein